MNTENHVFRFRGGSLPLGAKTYTAGILNLTPDSFYDGGWYNDIDSALRRCEQLISDGADIIDVGGESTRPGHSPISPGEELDRVMPALEKIRSVCSVPISLDTTRAAVALEGIKQGVSIINDVSGLSDPRMADVCADTGCGLILCAAAPGAEDVTLRTESFFDSALKKCAALGMERSHICLDPDIGFFKTYEENLRSIRELGRLKKYGLAVMLGVSRKSVIGLTLGLEVNERLEGSIALAVLGAQMGADIIRAHDVKQTVRALRMTDAVIREG